MAVVGASLTVAPGQALAVIGRTGAGKSSLIEALATALPLHSGDIRVDGMSVRTEARAVRHRLGYVPAGIVTWPHARSDEFLELFALEAGLGGTRMRSAVEKGLAFAGITDAATAIDTLPAGQSRRLLVARALLHDPSVLVIDAALSCLDPEEREAIERLVMDMHLGGRVVVAVIDDGDVPECFTHLAVLTAGEITGSGPNTHRAFDKGRHWRRRLTCPHAAGEAATTLCSITVDAKAIDDDTVVCVHDPARLPFAEILGFLAREGIPVEAADFDPPWTAQLVSERR